MENAKWRMGLNDEVEFIGNGEPRYGRVERIAADGSWFTIRLDGQFRTFRIENVYCFRNITVLGPRPGGFKSMAVNGEND